MLPKQNRLPGHILPFVLSSQAVFHHPLFSLRVSSSSCSSPRVGFIVSSKVAKKAVDRNRLKRLLRQAAYPHLKNLPPQTDLLFFAKHPLKTYLYSSKTPPQPLSAYFSVVLKQAKLINEKTSS
jgi:ribonuclease P protein component